MPYLSLTIISATPSARFEADGRSFIVSTNALLQKSGSGTVHGLATESAITAEIQTIDRDQITALVDAFVRSITRDGSNVSVVINDRVDRPLTTELKALAASFNSAPQKLTQKYLLSLPEGHWVVSNLMSRDGASIFAEPVAPADVRHAQWKRARAAGAAQRTCHAFPSESDYRRWLGLWVPQQRC